MTIRLRASIKYFDFYVFFFLESPWGSQTYSPMGMYSRRCAQIKQDRTGNICETIYASIFQGPMPWELMWFSAV